MNRRETKLHTRYVTCACGKRGYTDKPSAKAAQRRTPSGSSNVYRCRVTPDLWHVGSLPRGVVAGVLTRDDISDPLVRPNPYLR